MGQIIAGDKVKLICGFIFKDEAVLKKTVALLSRAFGRADFQSQVLGFSYTDYYEKEFGQGLKRSFVSFQKLILPERLAKIKLTTNNLEAKLAKGGLRRINIDPGYLELGKLVLASTKNYAHRIYLNSGVYAEITLFYQGHTFKAREWTYPDYRSSEYIAIFNQIRQIYAQQIKES